MLSNVLARLVLALFVLSAGGCVKSQLLRLETQDFTAEAAQATAAGEAAYVESVRANQELHALLYTLDARCVPPSLRPTDWKRPLTPPDDSEVSAFCLDLKNDLQYSSYDKEFLTLDFVTSYVAALAEAAADPELVGAAAFKQAGADFNTLVSALGKEGGIPDANLEAVAGLIDALEEVSADAESAKAIRGLFKDKGTRAQEEFEGLAEDLLRTQGGTTFDADAALLVRRLALGSRGTSSLDAATRERLLDSYHRSEQVQWRRNREVAKCKASKAVVENKLQRFCDAKAAGLMYATAQAHAELGQLIADNPNPRQRERQAKLAYRRFMDLVGVFVGLRGAF